MAATLSTEAKKRIAEKSGAGAVDMSVQQNSMQSNARAVAADKDEEDQVLIRNTINSQFVANKNFTNQDGVWMDTDFIEGSKLTEISVKFASEEYFKLSEQERGLVPYLALGEQVVVVWKGKIYRVTR